MSGEFVNHLGEQEYAVGAEVHLRSKLSRGVISCRILDESDVETAFGQLGVDQDEVRIALAQDVEEEGYGGCFYLGLPVQAVGGLMYGYLSFEE